MSASRTDSKQAAKTKAASSLDLKTILLEGRAFLALIIIIAAFSALSPNYFTINNFITMTSQVTIYGLLALGMLLVVLNGGIDLSVGSILGLSGMVAGFLMQGVHLEPLGIIIYFPVWAVALIACLTGAIVGGVNGVLISYLRVPAFVATLGTMYCARGVALLMTNGLTYNNLKGAPDLGNTGFDWLGFNTLFNIPIGIWVLAIVAIFCALLLRRTPFGRWLYAAGGNERAAELSGVPVKRVKISVYVMSGICAALAGLIMASQLTSAGPKAGETYELTAIAAVVIGGAALTGGRGNVLGTMLGAFVIVYLSNGLSMIGVSPYWQTVFTGTVIVVAVLINNLQYGKR